MALQFLLEGVQRGERSLYITLSETVEELQVVAVSHGWSLDGIHLYELTAAEEYLKMESQNTLFHPSEVELTEITQALLSEVERVQPHRVVFDSLSEVRLLAREPLRYRRQILALKQYFNGRDCTVLLLDEHMTEPRDLDVQSLAHGVVVLEQLAPDYGADRRRLRVQKLRGVQFRSGYHDFTIETGGLRVFPRLVAAEHHTPYIHEQIGSGIPELDAVLGGGLNRGTSSLLIGPAGAGKSLLASVYAIESARRGECAAIFTFDETMGTLFARSEGLGLDLRPLVDAGRVLVQQVDPAELSPGQFAHRVRDAVENDNAKVVVIDSLNGYLAAMPEDRFSMLHLHELLSYLGQQGVATLLIMAQHGLIGSRMDAPVDVSYLADCAILLRYFESGGEVRRAISVLKKRSGNHERSIREYKIEPGGIRVGPPLSEFRGVLTGVPVLEGNSNPLGR